MRRKKQAAENKLNNFKSPGFHRAHKVLRSVTRQEKYMYKYMYYSFLRIGFIYLFENCKVRKHFFKAPLISHKCMRVLFYKLKKTSFPTLMRCRLKKQNTLSEN